MNTLNDYWHFDTEKFIKSHRERLLELEDLKESIIEMPEVKAINYKSPPGTPGRGDSVPAAVSKIETIEKRIEELSPMIDIYQEAEKTLTAEEKLVVRYLFHEPGKTSSHIRFLCKSLHCERAQVYKMRQKAISKMWESIRHSI